jgi:hypothetical protein
MPKLVTCKALDFAHVLLLAVFARNLLALLYLAGKSYIFIINLVPTSIQLFIPKLLLNEVIPQP